MIFVKASGVLTGLPGVQISATFLPANNFRCYNVYRI